MLIALLTEKEYVTLRLPDRAEGKFACAIRRTAAFFFPLPAPAKAGRSGRVKTEG